MKPFVGKTSLAVHALYLWFTDPEAHPPRPKALGVVALVMMVAVPEWFPYIIGPVILLFLVVALLKVLENREYRSKVRKGRAIPDVPVRFRTAVVSNPLSNLTKKQE